jgi:hypothetical protein
MHPILLRHAAHCVLFCHTYFVMACKITKERIAVV